MPDRDPIYCEFLEPMRLSDFNPLAEMKSRTDYIVVFYPNGSQSHYNLTDPSIPLPRFRSLTIQEPSHA